MPGYRTNAGIRAFFFLGHRLAQRSDEAAAGFWRGKGQRQYTKVEHAEHVIGSREGMKEISNPDRSVLEAILGDGRFLLSLTGVALLISGWFAIAQSISGQLLPHDLHALGMDAAALRQHTSANLVRFMFHDRVAFGGTLLAIGIAYWWLAEFPLSEGAAWAWWTFAISGTCGFLSFLAYLGYGYLDTWHGVATLFLLPIFIGGLWRARRIAGGPLRTSVWSGGYRARGSAESAGRKLLLYGRSLKKM